MKVLHIVYNLIRGGTEGQCARFALELSRRGVTQRVAVFERAGFFLDAVEASCGPVYHVQVSRMLSAGALRAVMALRRFIRDEHVDLVHAWDADAAIFGAPAAKLAGIPFITSRRDLGQIYARRKLWLMRAADRRAAAIVVNAEAIRQRVIASGFPPSCVFLLPNIMDVAEFDAEAGRPCKTLEGRGPFVGCVARLNEEKDVATFLRAAARVRESLPAVTFVIAGDGPQRAELERLASALGLESSVQFLGDITAVPALLKRLSVGVLVPSRNEGLSNSILEYMAAGLPVVATDCGGNRELVEDGVTGRVVRCSDPAATAAAITNLLHDPAAARAMGAAGRVRVEGAFAPAVLAQQLERLYDAVLSCAGE